MRLILACLLILPVTAFAADGGSEGSAQPGDAPRCGALQEIKDVARQQYNERVIFDRPDDRGTRLIILSSDKTFTALRSTLDGRLACIITTDPTPPAEEPQGSGPLQPPRILDRQL